MICDVLSNTDKLWFYAFIRDWRSGMEFHQVRYFLMAAENLNFTRAAEQCHVSQPALTRAIQKLEDELCGDLFIRDGRSVTLSPLGDLMREHFQRIQATT